MWSDHSYSHKSSLVITINSGIKTIACNLNNRNKRDKWIILRNAAKDCLRWKLWYLRRVRCERTLKNRWNHLISGRTPIDSSALLCKLGHWLQELDDWEDECDQEKRRSFEEQIKIAIDFVHRLKEARDAKLRKKNPSKPEALQD